MDPNRRLFMGILAATGLAGEPAKVSPIQGATLVRTENFMFVPGDEFDGDMIVNKAHAVSCERDAMGGLVMRLTSGREIALDGDNAVRVWEHFFPKER
jgi:hypothetical protein